MSSNDTLVIVSGARTPMTEYSGTPGYGLLKKLSAIELGAIASKAALERGGVAPEKIDHLAVLRLAALAEEERQMGSEVVAGVRSKRREELRREGQLPHQLEAVHEDLANPAALERIEKTEKQKDRWRKFAYRIAKEQYAGPAAAFAARSAPGRPGPGRDPKGPGRHTDRRPCCCPGPRSWSAPA